MSSIPTFVSNYAERKSARVNHNNDHYDLERKAQESLPSPPTSDLSDGDETLPRYKKSRRPLQGKKKNKKSNLSTISARGDSKSCTSNDKLKEDGEE